MVKILINMTKRENKKVSKLKIDKELNTKQDTIKYIIRRYKDIKKRS